MIRREELHRKLDQVMEEEVERFVVNVPFARHLTDLATPLNEHYYLRHRVETIKRIRMTSKTDALALARMIEEDYQSARSWSEYTAQELSHDLLYLKDLKKHGYSEAQINAIQAFPSTERMVHYLEDRIGELGSLPAVVYSLFVEWNSARYSSMAVNKAASHYSHEHVAGSRTHVLIDSDLDHYSMMVDITHRLVTRKSNEQIAFALIDAISSFFRDYFRELYDETVFSVQPL